MRGLFWRSRVSSLKMMAAVVVGRWKYLRMCPPFLYACVCVGCGYTLLTDRSRHGRDHKLRVWRITSADEELLDKRLPVERSKQSSSSSTTTQPWLVHSLAVNALNFCAFSLCFVPEIRKSSCVGDESSSSDDPEQKGTSSPTGQRRQRNPLLLAVPNALNSGAVDIFHLPSERRVSTIPADSSVQTGMVMAVHIFFTAQGDDLYVVSGYEDGQVMVHVRRGPGLESWTWEKLYASRPHSQPVLSLDIPPGKERKDYFITSSADALIVKHPIPHITSSSAKGKAKAKEGEEGEEEKVQNAPLKVLNTKHAGQQGLRVRSDNKIFATAGWDARVRVYSCKTMKELAVLKWHKEGCYAMAFAEILDSGGGGSDVEGDQDQDQDHTSPTAAAAATASSTSPDGKDQDQEEENRLDLVPAAGSLKAIQQQRSQKAQRTHWLAAGSKDGKVSLWDIY